jgi:hypothetical protein
MIASTVQGGKYYQDTKITPLHVKHWPVLMAIAVGWVFAARRYDETEIIAARALNARG